MLNELISGEIRADFLGVCSILAELGHPDMLPVACCATV